jgi:hypothetical protein
MLSLDDQKFAMDTIMLQVSIEKEIPIDSLSVFHNKVHGEWFVVNNNTGRGIAKVLAADL